MQKSSLCPSVRVRILHQLTEIKDLILKISLKRKLGSDRVGICLKVLTFHGRRFRNRIQNWEVVADGE